MDQLDDATIKAEIDDITDRINRIIQKVEELNPDSKTEPEQGEE